MIAASGSHRQSGRAAGGIGGCRIHHRTLRCPASPCAVTHPWNLTSILITAPAARIRDPEDNNSPSAAERAASAIVSRSFCHMLLRLTDRHLLELTPELSSNQHKGNVFASQYIPPRSSGSPVFYIKS